MGAAAIATLRPRLTVDLGALARNWRALNAIARDAMVGAVVKADAYGTGQAAAGRALFAAGARFFFVATPDEGMALRATLADAHIFVLDGLVADPALYAEYRLMPVLNTLETLGSWLDYCLGRNDALPAALHVDTGMNRLGLGAKEVVAAKQRCDELGYTPQVVMSHLACADRPEHALNQSQRASFTAALDHFPGVPASLANSAATMTRRDMHFQLVRPGIALFGGRAVGGRPNPMSPVVTLEAPILQIRDVAAGASVGYGAAQTMRRDSRVAIVGLGYADGLLRAAGGDDRRPGASVFLHGRRVPLLGRVSMDMFALDATDLGLVPAAGDMVEIFGPNAPVDALADSAGTIGYEILTGSKGRYPRRYISDPATSGAP